MMAPKTAATITAQSDTRCWEATTPPSRTAISPGKTNPRKAEASSAGRAKTKDRTSQPGKPRMRSVMLASRARDTMKTPSLATRFWVLLTHQLFPRVDRLVTGTVPVEFYLRLREFLNAARG